jgi:hypothetical protein
MRFNVRLDTSHHGPPHPFKDSGMVVDSLTGICTAMVKCLFVVTMRIHLCPLVLVVNIDDAVSTEKYLICKEH